MTTYTKNLLFFLGKFALSIFLILTISRLVLIIWQWPRINALNDAYTLLIGGIRIDIALISQLTLIPCLLLMLINLTPLSGRLLHPLIRIGGWCALLGIVLMEVATPGFLSEYGTRPNRLFFEYLDSPNEVLGMLFKGYAIHLFAATILLSLTAWLSRSWLSSKNTTSSHFSVFGFISMLGICLLLVLGARSGFQHRPINPSMVAFSHDRMVNSLALNSSYSVLYAIYQLKNEASASLLYGSIPEDQMIDIIKHEMPANSKFIDPNYPTLHSLKPSIPYQAKNLIIIVEESLGAQFVGALGGKGLTPTIDKWKDKSWFFNRLYATGTRSARGLEAISSGFIPSPARAVLKLPKAQGGFFTLGEALSQQGYHTSFIYGGESHFDNMKGFFLGNGFQQAFDQNDYDDPEFKGTWGVSDGDLFQFALNYLLKKTDKPKFSLIFTSSNHTPFEFPDNKIELHDSNKQTVNNAVKYADYALGLFLDNLEQQGLLTSSVVLVVADHDTRVTGDALVPINKFHVPGFIISSDVIPHTDSTLISHIDLAPTLLSLLGIESPNPMIGQDLTQIPDDYIGRAIMQYGEKQAFLQGERMVILQANKKPTTYAYVQSSWELTSSGELETKALAHAQLASWLYDNEKYVSAGSMTQ